MPTETTKFNFSGLFTIEMANNHQGSLSHGKRIIEEVGKVVHAAGVKAAVKLQFRDLDTFIHPDFKGSKDNKHIGRFLSTRLTKQEFAELVKDVKKHGMISMATPFDEPSVDLIKELGVEIVKIASCSAKDWPLLEKAVSLGKPMIVSTGGLTIEDVDKLVSFLDHRYAHYALMHCVSIYPTPSDKLQLKQIEIFRKRYPHVTVGFSTHEKPDNMDAIKYAYAKGARIFERHVGIPTDTVALNAYSSTPAQIADWIDAYKEAVLMEGGDGDKTIEPKEEEDLVSLMRGVYVKRDINEGEKLTKEDVFFAMPLREGQLTSGSFKEGVLTDRYYPALSPVSVSLRDGKPSNKDLIYHTIHKVKGMLNEARVPIGTDFNVELSHHYGLENFRETGVIIIDCINREYCKKILVQLPGQKHPHHHHTKKEEAFQVLSGILEIELDGHRRTLYPGDVAVVQRGVKHRFWSDTGAIFEEISTTHYNDDSFYEDIQINEMPREARKTKLVNWGRHQFD